MIKKLFCKLGLHKYTLYDKIDLKRFDIKSKSLKEVYIGRYWECEYCRKRIEVEK